MAGDTAGERELLEKALHPRNVFRDIGVVLGVRPLQVDVDDERRAPMTRTRDINHIQIMLFDNSVKMDVDEILAGGSPPVAKQAGLDVCKLQRLAQEGVVEEVDLADRQVVGGPPV